MSARAPQIALSEVIGALSYALDVTEGEPPGHAMRTCQIGMRLAQALELDAATRSRLFYALLLKDAGCSANSAKMAALFGADDHVAKRTSKRINWSERLPAFVWSARTVAPGGSLRARLHQLQGIKAEGQVTRALMQARCDRGAEIALMLGLEVETAEAIRALDEHWDGRGQPRARRRGARRPFLKPPSSHAVRRAPATPHRRVRGTRRVGDGRRRAMRRHRGQSWATEPVAVGDRLARRAGSPHARRRALPRGRRCCYG